MSSFRNLRNVSCCDPTGEVLRYVDSNEAKRLVAAGDHEMFCVSCRRVKGEGPCLTRTNHLMAIRQIPPEVKDDTGLKAMDESDCALTERDSRRNVGITEGFKGKPADAGQIRRAQTRIAQWGWASAHDARAVTVVSA